MERPTEEFGIYSLPPFYFAIIFAGISHGSRQATANHRVKKEEAEPTPP